MLFLTSSCSSAFLVWIFTLAMDFYSTCTESRTTAHEHMNSVNEFAVMLHVRAIKVTDQSYTTSLCKFLRSPITVFSEIQWACSLQIWFHHPQIWRDDNA